MNKQRVTKPDNYRGETGKNCKGEPACDYKNVDDALKQGIILINMVCWLKDRRLKPPIRPLRRANLADSARFVATRVKASVCRNRSNEGVSK